MRLNFLVESLILYLAFFKTILATLFRAFGLPLSFLPSKPSFLHDPSTTQHSHFWSKTTDKPVNRSIQAYAPTQLNVFAFKGFIFCDIYKKTRKEFQQFGLWNSKNMWLEHTLVHAHLWHKSTQIEYSSQKMAQNYENSELYWKTQLLLKWFAYQAQSYWNTDLWSRGTNFWDTLYTKWSWKLFISILSDYYITVFSVLSRENEKLLKSQRFTRR